MVTASELEKKKMATLNTERNTAAMQARVMRAFKRYYWHGTEPRYRSRRAENFKPAVFFEHGQWWAGNTFTGAQWSANDAEGSEALGVFDGFCFERVTDGDEGELR